MSEGSLVRVAVEWFLKYVLRERRVVKAYTSALPLLSVHPAWQQDIQVTFRGTPITGFFYYRVTLKNVGNRSVQNLPINIAISPGSLMAWPNVQPQGCLKNPQFPSFHQLSAEIDFINPREEVTLFFWSFNDTGGTITVNARAPDVEFSSEPWKPSLPLGARVGITVHYIVFAIGCVVTIVGLAYLLHRWLPPLFRAIRAALGV